LAPAQVASPPSEDVFAYLLGDAPPTIHVLRALAASGLRGRAYVRRGGGAHRAVLAGSGIAWLDRPEPAREAFSRARLVVHHGSMLTAEEALAAGRPQLVVPLYLEHLFTARGPRGLGVAAVVTASASPPELAAALASVSADSAVVHVAREVADRYWREAAPEPGLARRLLRKITSA
jgi:UDP:flavonoid glycosyltransferase YjiC (YdhE family)